MKPLTLIACLLAIISSSCAQTTRTPPDVQTRIEQVEESLAEAVVLEGQKKWTLEERMKFYNIKGLSVAVIKDYKLDWAKAYGWADEAEHRKVTTETVFQAASISKSLNGVGVLKLAQEGKIDLNADINTYLTSWKFPYDSLSKKKRITTTNLLSHTAGLTVHGFGGYVPGEPLPTVPEILDGKKPANSDAVRSMFEPDLRVEYSGGGTTISQCIVTDVTHLAYDRYMWLNVLQPLGMTYSFYTQPPPSSRKASLATGYLSDGQEVQNKFRIHPEQAAAGLWTNPTDLAKYIIETQLSWKGKSAKVLSSANTKLRLTPVRDAAGLGVFVTKRGTDLFFEHGGSNVGFRCVYMGGVESGDGVAIMVNSDNGGILQEIVNSVASVYGWQGNYGGKVKKIVMLQPAQLKALEGYYEMEGNKEMHLQFTAKNNQLILKQLWDGREVTFDAESELEFFNQQFPFPLKFSKDASGKVSQVLAFERDTWKRVDNYVPPKP
ncbi:MAG TPA: serine hydrolase domain-containing protein [Chryseolinea sp.]